MDTKISSSPTKQEQNGQKEQSVFSAPTISIPKGGGAIHGMGEKFAANPVTGTSSMSVPIAVSPGRSGFGPQLNLSYDSGSGNGPFGFGWSLSLPSITRKTDKGLPQYQDSVESDVFILSGAEDLVPVYRQDLDGSWVAVHRGSQRDADGSWVRDSDGHLIIHEDEIDGYHVRRYCPRIEGLFARIERWTSNLGDVHWRSISKDNITTLYGRESNSRIFDPAQPEHIFTWLICESYDDKGNHIIYTYVEENGQGVDPAQAHEQNRPHGELLPNRYIKHIQYGNRVSRLAPPDLTSPPWMFEVIFDYGEGHYTENPPDDDGYIFVQGQINRPVGAHGTMRPDPFSTYRAGFEVRTYRRCQRVLMFHHFTELGDDPCLVRSTEFEYNDLDHSNPPTVEAELAYQGSTCYASFIQSITQSGYVRQPLAGQTNRYLKKSLPPLAFEYSKAVIQDDIRELDSESLENLPIGLDGLAYQWVDLDGEGLSGILTEQGGNWYYKRNLGDGHFGSLEPVAAKPSLATLSGGQHQLLDLAGDGQLDVVAFAGPTPGFFERTPDEGWEPFTPFKSLPNIDWRDPNLRFVDLNGDGHADVLITEAEALTWYPSLAENGFAAAQRVRIPFDEEQGPRLVFADGTQSIYLADMSADGLNDLMRIRNGEVCYWPNLGYGRFGARVVMDNSPWFDAPDQFDQKRIRLADIDGSGATDIIYIGGDGVRLYFNQSGNRWSAPRILVQFPRVDNLSAIMTADLLGNGTACLVWSSPLPGDARRPLRYIDLMGGQKPHLLVKSVNNLGAATRIQYAASTKFYLQDKRDGKPWITKLAFPVHVVERVETYDYISRNRFVTRYSYHHGYFDGFEREFRGFGMVEQWDSEEFSALDDPAQPQADNHEAAFHVPPVYTKTWFHTGVFFDRQHISNFFAGLLNDDDRGEYYREPNWQDDDVEAKKRLLDDTILPPNLSADEEREACRALKGSMLRQEVYALDGTPNAQHPYTVTEQNFTVECLQLRDSNRHALFFVHPREAINYHYERNPRDPRVTHTLTLEVDEFGNVLRSLSIAYPRADLPEQQPEQCETHLTLTINRVANNNNEPDWRRIGLPVETRTYEVVKPPTAVLRFGWDEMHALVAALIPPGSVAAPSENTIPYEQWAWRRGWRPQDEPGGLTDGAPTHTRLRLIEHVRTRYRSDNLDELLPLGQIGARALPGESYKLAFTASLLAQVFKPEQISQPYADLLAEAGYRVEDGDWWIPSGHIFYSDDPSHTPAQELSEAATHFFLPRRYRDPFGNDTRVEYDSPNHLLVSRSTDALGNVAAALNDYRVLQPALLTDPNGNRSAVTFDALGLPVATAVMGKNDEAKGDLLEGFDADPTLAALQAFADDPHGQAATLLGKATTRIVYDLDGYRRTGQPPFAATLVRETHFHDPGGEQTKIQVSFSYSDGFGREIQRKAQAEPGPIAADGPLVSPRWVGSGWTIFNNKGKPVRQYEPFFDDTHHFHFGQQVGVSSILFYDPLERIVATLHPNHTYEKVIFNPWEQTTYDVNDTVRGDPRTDDSISGYVAAYFETQPNWQAWYNERIHQPDDDPEHIAAQKAAAHANTPTRAYFDVLGRPFLTIADNGPAGAYETRVEQDIENNQRSVTDALGRIVMIYDYDMLGNHIQQASMEAGERWTLNDAAGKPFRAWDSRGHAFRFGYDALRRPTESHVSGGDGPVPLDHVYERIIYGEGQHLDGDFDHELNLRGKPFAHYDTAGKIQFEAYDFKGNLLGSARQLVQDYTQTVNWAQTPALQQAFHTSTTYDALNRPLTAISPDHSIYRPAFNEANLLERVDVNLRSEIDEQGQPIWTQFVTNIDYDAKGQRTRIEYANGATTTYEYDPLTFRLTRLTTVRPPSNGLAAQLFKDPSKVQDLHYAYDPIGNITRIEDAALKTVFYNNQQVEPICTYTYDALYQLIQAHGREHIVQTAFNFNPPDGNYRDNPFTGLAAGINDLQALRNYIETYEYDAAGNFQTMRHSASNGNWKRHYTYQEASLLEAARFSNRLSQTHIGSDDSRIDRRETYTHDIHGNMTSMPHLENLHWDFKDRLQKVELGDGIAYYTYNSSGERTRKVIERGAKIEERIYIGGYEIYREFQNGVPKLERETLHVMDDKQRIALIDTLIVENSSFILPPSSLVRYQLSNHLGSASLELAADGALISYEEYHPYGTTTFQTGRSATEVNLKRYCYTGKERDDETGLGYYGARYYIVWLSRWASPEPLGLKNGTNLYTYVSNRPIKYIDIDGRDLLDVAKGAIVGAAIAVTFALLLGGAATMAPPLAPAIAEVAVPMMALAVAGTIQSVGNWFSSRSSGDPSTIQSADFELGVSLGGWLGGALGGRLLLALNTIIPPNSPPPSAPQLQPALGGQVPSIRLPSISFPQVASIPFRGISSTASSIPNFSSMNSMGGNDITNAENSPEPIPTPESTHTPESERTATPTSPEESALAGTTSNYRGIVGEERTLVDIQERGGTPIGQHVTFVGPTGQRATIDHIWVDSEGNLRGTEAKFGPHARLTMPQRDVFPNGGHLTLTPVGGSGSRAFEAGLRPNEPVGIHVDIVYWEF